jgi:hypothetical protein
MTLTAAQAGAIQLFSRRFGETARFYTLAILFRIPITPDNR